MKRSIEYKAYIRSPKGARICPDIIDPARIYRCYAQARYGVKFGAGFRDG